MTLNLFVTMRSIHRLVLLTVCVFVLSGESVLSILRDEKPEIMSQSETVLQVHDNHTVFCQGHSPLRWTTPKVEENKQSWTTFNTKKMKPVNKHYQYGLQLEIVNMSYPFVGFYYCHYENVDVDDPDESTSIYLYVNDTQHFTPLEIGNRNLETVTVTQYEEAVIPCRPTSPDVEVTLFTIDGAEVPLDDLFGETLYRYDPRRGILTNDTIDLHKERIFDCTFIKNSKSQSTMVKVDVEIIVSHLATPYIIDLNEGHTVIGETLILRCVVKTQNLVKFHWGLPSGHFDSNRMYRNQTQRELKTWQTLAIFNTTIADNGTYYCNASDYQGHSSSNHLDVKIFDKNENFLSVKEASDIYSIIATAGDPSVQWVIEIKGHPRPIVTWLNNRNDTIRMENGDKYEAYYNSSMNTAFLKIKDIQIQDFGYFTLLASNNKTEEKLSLFLNVTDKPTVILDTKDFYEIGSLSTVKCYAYAYPEPLFEWFFKPCLNRLCDYTKVNGTMIKSEGFEFISEATINASESGQLKCMARNYKGSAKEIKGFFVSDIKNGFDIFGWDSGIDVNEEQRVATIAEGDTVSVTCGASNLNYSHISWLYNNIPIANDNRYTLTKSSTQYSTKVNLEIEHASFSDSGLYSCKVTNKNGEYMYLNMTFNVASPVAPSIVNTTLHEEIEMKIPDKLMLYCNITGIPKPTLKWYKNGVLFVPAESERIRVFDGNKKIFFKYTEAQDEGTYKCESTNKMGVALKQQTVKFNNLPHDPKWLIAVVVLLALISLGTVIFIFIKIRKEKQLQRELKLLGLANFEKGAVENINPELGIDDQAELLPYDQKWEFPIEHLKLGKQLGSGAFGVVMKGVAKNIVEGETETTVAVKMVKKNADHTYIRALASELKIMVHLGKHLNVVNLLGACTKNVAKRELLVIVEFCRYGNLQNYLLRHRDNFVDQVDPKTGKVDYVIGQEFFDRTYSVSSDRSTTQSPSLKYAALTFSNSSNQTVLPPSNNMGDYRANTEVSMATDMTMVSQGEDGVILSNNSVQPEWRSNYKGDYKGNVKPICTKDLLAWAFQVARGMEYLASRKVLHGDLAARNILLADNNIVKICDFGLAKSMYKNDNYKKKGDGPLPVKWMAIESIRDRVFSTQSDVWSFGIVLWEFFSLARTPYPGMEADERLYQKLLDGYRMESPQYAPKEIYIMMTECWSAKPVARPSFTKLAERLGSLLEISVRKHYIDLNDPYLVMNTQRLEDGQSDYLAMLSPPTFEALSSPHYVNEMVGQESLEDSGYLSMKPSTIFSPRVEEGPVFDFNVNKRKPLTSEEGNKMELLPMLSRTSDSGCETPLQSPTSPNSFSNPSYLIPPKIEEENHNSNNNTDIMKSPDNYVNMPQNKNLIKDKVMNQTNPFVDTYTKNDSPHYVNNTSKDWESVKV